MTWDCLAAPARGIARRRWAELACQPVVNPVASGGARLRLRSDLRWLGGLVAAAVLIPLLAPLSGLSGGAVADPIADKRAEAQRIAVLLAAQSRQVSVLAERLDEARLNADELNKQVDRARADVAQTDQQVASKQAKLRVQAVNAYVTGGNASLAQLLVQTNQEDVGLRRNYLDTVTGQERDALDSLRAARLALEEKRVEMARAQDAARAAVNQVAAAEHDAAAADGAERATLNRVQGELAALVAQEQQRQAAAQAARLQAQLMARLAASRANNQATTPGPPTGTSPSPLPGPSDGASAAVEEARRQLGKPYQYGGSGPNGFDCSGLTAWAWRAGGRSLPHSASSQYYATTHIPVSALQPGDLVFYGSPPHHVGIYVGGDQMINALHSGTSVRYDSIYVEGDLIGGGRVN